MNAIPESCASRHTYILVTGANTGLGFGICCRLVDDFLNTKPPTSQLTLIFTTRSAKKGSDTLRLFQAHLLAFKHRLASTTTSTQTTTPSSAHHGRIHLRPENVELTSLLSVRALTRRLLRSGSGVPRLDAIILNAGIGGWIGIDWPLAVSTILTDLIQAVTFPRFKLSNVGALTSPQLPPTTTTTTTTTPSGEKIPAEPPLGEVFCANVFGHYMLVHWLAPLLQSSGGGEREAVGGRVIWMSSVEVTGTHFDREDLQGLTSPKVYEHTKRLIDVMVLTAQDQPATSKAVDAFLHPKKEQQQQQQQQWRDDTAQETTSPPSSTSSKPTIHVVHPGILATTILPFASFLNPGWVALCWLIRVLGSPWHTVTAYAAAYAPVWLALASQDEILHHRQQGTDDDNDDGPAPIKWGTAVNRSGKERAEKTHVDGWGVDGSGQPVDWWGGSWGRKSGTRDPTREDIEAFIQEGARVWSELEELRRDWEGRIEKYDKASEEQY